MCVANLGSLLTLDKDINDSNLLYSFLVCAGFQFVFIENSARNFKQGFVRSGTNQINSFKFVMKKVIRLVKIQCKSS